MKCANCNHEKKYHAVKESHVLGSSHCTKSGCDCKEFVEKKVIITKVKQVQKLTENKKEEAKFFY